MAENQNKEKDLEQPVEEQEETTEAAAEEKETSETPEAEEKESAEEVPEKKSKFFKKDKKDKKTKSDSGLVVPNTNDLSCHVRRPNSSNKDTPSEVYMGEMPSKDPEKKKLFWIERPYLLN